MKIVLILLIGFINSAYAKSCQKLKLEQGTEVIKLLKSANTSEVFVIDKYCEHCQDNYPKPILVNSYQLTNLPGNEVEIQINNQSIDLTYIYVQGRNIASIIGCNPIAVSKNLD